MKLKQFLQSTAVVLLLGVFFYATTVKEFHYLFTASHHEAIHTDNCDHHLHATDHAGQCEVCKLDLNSVLKTDNFVYEIGAIFLPKEKCNKVVNPLLNKEYSYCSLRGPPAFF